MMNTALSIKMALLLTLVIPAVPALGDEPPPTGTPETSHEDLSPEAEELERIKQRYWAQGNEKEMGVVQNRLFTKEGRFETTLFGGLLISDPFVNTFTPGLSFGYNFDETFSLHAFGWKALATPSAALVTLRQGEKEANTNPTSALFGTEGRASLLYGKLSLLGRKILYYDMHAGLGAAIVRAENGLYGGPLISVGQSFFFSNSMTFRIDYRLIVYRENITQKEGTEEQLGRIIDQRNNFSNSLTFGISILFGGSNR